MSVTGLTGVFGLHRQVGANMDLNNPSMTAKGPYNAGVAGNLNQDTVQTLTVVADGGSFRLAFRGEITGNIAWNANGATMASGIISALEALDGIDAGDVAVSGTGPFTISFVGSAKYAGQPIGVNVYDHKLTRSGGLVPSIDLDADSTGGRWYYLPATSVNFQPQQIVQSIPPEVGGDLWARGSYKGGVHGEGQVMLIPRGGLGLAELFLGFTGTRITPTTVTTNFGQVIEEIQTVTGTATGGSFTLTYDGQTTGSIAFNASASAVQAALVALSNVEPGDIICSGTAVNSGGISVRFSGRFSGKNVPAMTSNNAGLSGGTVSVATTVSGLPFATKLIGNGSNGIASNNFKYRFIPQSGTAAELPWYTLIRNVGGKFVEEFADARIGNFAFDLANTNLLNVDASFISRRVGTIALGSGPSSVGAQKAGNGLPFQAVDATVRLDTNTGTGPGPVQASEALLPTRLNIGFANQLSNNEHVVGSYYLQDITNQSRTANVTYSVYLKDADLYARAYNYGADMVAQDSAWSSKIWKGALQLTLQGGQIGNTADYYKLDIVIPEMDYMATPISLAGNNLVEYQLTTNVVLSQNPTVSPFYIDYTTDENIY